MEMVSELHHLLQLRVQVWVCRGVVAAQLDTVDGALERRHEDCRCEISP
jgi:hypothetical protein